ncbi:MAG: HAMP domain-containing protein [Deltaproteobacteria bacterium]|nr:HAMP domain-containing protein [Deltaproteobacteria bacterium]
MPPRARFRRRLALAALGLAIAPVLVVGWLLIGVNQDALEDTDRDLLFAVIGDVSRTLDGTLDEGAGALATVAQLTGDASLTPPARVAAARALVGASPALTAVRIFDHAGVPIDTIRDAGDHTPLPDALGPELRANAAPAMGGIVLTPAGPAMAMVAPIHLSDDTWYAYAPVSLAPLGDRVARIADETFAGDRESIYVIDRQFRIVAHPDPERAMAMATTARTELLAGLERAPGGEQYLVFRGFDGPDGAMIGAVRSLPRAPLAVVAQLPRARAFASIGRMRWVVAIVVAAAALLAALLALVLASRVSAPVRRLVAYAGALAQRNWNARADVHTGDELEMLGDAMQGAAAELAASEAQLRDEAAIRNDLGRYLPEQLVERVVKREQSLRLGGERRQITVLFADVASFTALTEKHPPEVVVTILNQLFTILTEIVFRHGGTVDKFIGDCVMAFWNAPDDQPDHAARAVAAAIDMLRWLEVGNDAWQAAHGVTIHLAIGVNTGEAVVGNFGSEARMEYTVIGDAVNIAARLESLARPQQILIAQPVVEALGDRVDTLPLGPQRLPGRLEPMPLWEVIA